MARYIILEDEPSFKTKITAAMDEAGHQRLGEFYNVDEAGAFLSELAQQDEMHTAKDVILLCDATVFDRNVVVGGKSVKDAGVAVATHARGVIPGIYVIGIGSNDESWSDFHAGKSKLYILESVKRHVASLSAGGVEMKR